MCHLQNAFLSLVLGGSGGHFISNLALLMFHFSLLYRIQVYLTLKITLADYNTVLEIAEVINFLFFEYKLKSESIFYLCLSICQYKIIYFFHKIPVSIK